MSLLSGQQLNCAPATKLLMPDEAIDQVHRLSRRSLTGLEFQDGRNSMMPNDDNDGESTYVDIPDDASIESDTGDAPNDNVNISTIPD